MPRWLLFTLLAVVCWGIWAVLSKLVGDALTAVQMQALSTAGLLPVLVALGCSSPEADPGDRRRGAAVGALAGGLTCLGNVACYHALASGAKAATVVPLTALYPLVTVLLAVAFLGERLHPIQWAGVALALAAIGAFNVGSVEGMMNPWLAYALLPVALWGVSGLLQKISTDDTSGNRSAWWFLAAFVPVGIVLLAVDPLPAWPAARTCWLVAGLGLFFSLGNYAILLAFANAGKASIIGPLASLYPLVSVPIAITLLHERITPREAAGIAVALVAVAALAWPMERRS
ncbi:MAG: DMT family transporter [Planctomycetota bacterium]